MWSIVAAELLEALHNVAAKEVPYEEGYVAGHIVGAPLVSGERSFVVVSVLSLSGVSDVVIFLC